MIRLKKKIENGWQEIDTIDVAQVPKLFPDLPDGEYKITVGEELVEFEVKDHWYNVRVFKGEENS